MPKATVDRRPPPLFRQGLTPLSKLLLLSALSVLLMVVDTRLQLGAPLRAAVATALTPLQWLALAPIRVSVRTRFAAKKARCIKRFRIGPVALTSVALL